MPPYHANRYKYTSCSLHCNSSCRPSQTARQQKNATANRKTVSSQEAPKEEAPCPCLPHQQHHQALMGSPALNDSSKPHQPQQVLSAATPSHSCMPLPAHCLTNASPVHCRLPPQFSALHIPRLFHLSACDALAAGIEGKQLPLATASWGTQGPRCYCDHTWPRSLPASDSPAAHRSMPQVNPTGQYHS